MNQAKTCYDCASFNKCLERRGICSDFKERVTPRKMSVVWWVIWTDGTRATCSGTFADAINMGTRKGIGFKIE